MKTRFLFWGSFASGKWHCLALMLIIWWGSNKSCTDKKKEPKVWKQANAKPTTNRHQHYLINTHVRWNFLCLSLTHKFEWIQMPTMLLCSLTYSDININLQLIFLTPPHLLRYLSFLSSSVLTHLGIYLPFFLGTCTYLTPTPTYLNM